MNSEVSCRFDGFWKMAINSSLRDCSEANCASLSTRLVEGAILERNPLAVGSTNDTLSDAYTVQRTHTKTKTKPSYVPATFCDQKQMSAEGSDA